MKLPPRTSIRALEIDGYRSIEHLKLEDLPALVVLLGKNGSGKSNLLRAIRLALSAAGHLGQPTGDKQSLSYQQAKDLLGLRPQDFRRGGPPIIQIRLTLDLGPRFSESSLGFEWEDPYKIAFTARIEDNGRGIDTSFLDGHIDGKIPRIKATEPAHQERDLLSKIIEDLEERKGRNELQVFAHDHFAFGWLHRHLPNLESSEPRLRLFSSEKIEEATHIAQDRYRIATSRLAFSLIFDTRFRDALLGRLARYSDAERRVEEEPIGNQERPRKGIQEELARASRSENSEVAQALTRLGRALGRVKLFGEATADQVPLRAAESEMFREHLLMITPPEKKELPLHNLSSGERQIVLMLGHQVLRPWPIAFIEEPEAHLHKELLLKLAAYLQGSVEPYENAPPDSDQLWLATHHHAFAMAPCFYEVSLDEQGRTTVQKRPRSEAIRHFYEPNPYWDALEDLARDGLDESEVLMIDEDGKKVTVTDLRASIQGDRLLANRFVRDSLRSVLLSLKSS